jgi:hypothetical protein
MKYHPYLLFILCIKRHITEDAYQLLLAELKAHGYFTFKELVGIISHYFDLENLTKNPLDIGDAWVYNYINFRRTRGFKMEEVMALYEKEMAPAASSKYVVHLRHKEIMDIIKRITPKPQKSKPSKQSIQLRMFD